MTRTLTNDQAREIIKQKKSFNDLVRMRWPEMTDDECAYVLWELTPFPMIQGVHEIMDAITELPESETWGSIQ